MFILIYPYLFSMGINVEYFNLILLHTCSMYWFERVIYISSKGVLRLLIQKVFHHIRRNHCDKNVCKKSTLMQNGLRHFHHIKRIFLGSVYEHLEVAFLFNEWLKKNEVKNMSLHHLFSFFFNFFNFSEKNKNWDGK